MSVDVTAPPSAPPVPGRRRRAWPWWRVAAAALLAAFVTVTVVHSARSHYHHAVRLEPLRVVARAAAETHQPIGTISPDMANQWIGGRGPTEAELIKVVQPGNGYLEPLYYSLLADRPGGAPQSSTYDSCYYVAVAPGGVFDADRVVYLGQFCFTHGELRASGFVSPFLP